MSKISEELEHSAALLNSGDLDAAHSIVQLHEGHPLADAIHAVIHRREGDYSNSLYWWRRVGQNIPKELLDFYGDPIQFTSSVRGCNDPAILENETAAIQAAILSSTK